MPVLKFVYHYFKNRKKQFNKSEISNYPELINNDILIEKENGVLEINNDSQKLNKTLLDVAEKKLDKSLPLNISKAFKFVDEFEKHLQKEYHCERVINSFSHLIRGLKGYVLYILHSEHKINAEEFLLSLEEKSKRPHHLFLFESIFFDFLLHSDYSEKNILKVCKQLWEKPELRYDISKFLKRLSQRDKNKSKILLDCSLKEKNNNSLVSNILIGLYNTGDKTVFSTILNLEGENKTICLHTLGALLYNDEKHILKAYQCIAPLDFDGFEIAKGQCYLLSTIIQNSKTSAKLKEKCFNHYYDFLKDGTKEIKEIAFSNIYLLKGNESKKYHLLHLYISKTQKLDVIKDYFYTFEEPKYIFDITMRLFEKIPDYRFSMDLFENGIIQAWNANQNETENLILNLFQHPAYGILALKVIFIPRGGIFQVDLLKLEEKEFQVNAIKSICKHPHSFDKLLPILLPLRNSKFKEVKQYLQNELAEKMFVYRDNIYEQILGYLSESKKDKLFLKPIKKALDNYHKLKELKESINDLNPYENEKDLIELYYMLDAEENAKMMNEANKGKGTFMEGMRTVIVVRGNSTKYGEKDPIPLARIESSMLIDGSSFLNPDLYEHKLNTIE